MLARSVSKREKGKESGRAGNRAGKRGVRAKRALECDSQEDLTPQQSMLLRSESCRGQKGGHPIRGLRKKPVEQTQKERERRGEKAMGSGKGTAGEHTKRPCERQRGRRRGYTKQEAAGEEATPKKAVVH